MTTVLKTLSGATATFAVAFLAAFAVFGYAHPAFAVLSGLTLVCM